MTRQTWTPPCASWATRISRTAPALFPPGRANAASFGRPRGMAVWGFQRRALAAQQLTDLAVGGQPAAVGEQVVRHVGVDVEVLPIAAGVLDEACGHAAGAGGV